MDRIRHQLFLPKDLSERLDVLAAKPGATKSAILVDAVTAWLNRRAASELEDRFGIRLDRMTTALGRIERDRRRAMLRTAMGPAIGFALADPRVLEIMVNPDGALRLDVLGQAWLPRC